MQIVAKCGLALVHISLVWYELWLNNCNYRVKIECIKFAMERGKPRACVLFFLRISYDFHFYS